MRLSDGRRIVLPLLRDSADIAAQFHTIANRVYKILDHLRECFGARTNEEMMMRKPNAPSSPVR